MSVGWLAMGRLLNGRSWLGTGLSCRSANRDLPGLRLATATAWDTDNMKAAG